MKRILSILLLSIFILFSAFALLDVYYIDVGQADFELIICDGHAMVIDGGNTADGQLVFSVLKKYVPDGVIDYYIGTHAHEDHMGAAASVLNAVKAKAIYCPNNDATQKFFQNFLKYAENQGVTPTCPPLGLEFSLGGASVKVLGPFHPNDKNENNTSIVLKLTYGDTSFLFTGDAEAEEEKELVGKWGNELKSEVLKVGHHGADTSSTYLFLRSVLPIIGIISVGENN
jgi:competence protein ComEC